MVFFFASCQHTPISLKHRVQEERKKETMADEIEYKLDHVAATPVAANDIDATFRSSCIGTNTSSSCLP